MFETVNDCQKIAFKTLNANCQLLGIDYLWVNKTIFLILAPWPGRNGGCPCGTAATVCSRVATIISTVTNISETHRAFCYLVVSPVYSMYNDMMCMVW